jgi:ribosomal protein S18 acetylase RimI-like enzyme
MRWRRAGIGRVFLAVPRPSLMPRQADDQPRYAEPILDLKIVLYAYLMTSGRRNGEFLHAGEPPKPTHATVCRRYASDADRAFAWNLNRSVYRGLCIALLGGWEEEWQQRHFEEKWQRGGFEIVSLVEREVGVLWVTRGKNAHILHEIQMSPDYQNQGIGTLLLKEEIYVSIQAGRHLLLNVLKGNRGQNLYERLGFQITGSRGLHLLVEHTGKAA